MHLRILKGSFTAAFIAVLWLLVGTQTAFANTGTITGTIYQADGTTPLADMIIWGVDEYYNYQQNVCTDVNGNYTLTAVPDQVEIYVSAGGAFTGFCSGSADYVYKYYGNEYVFSDASTVVVPSAGATVSDIDITLELGGTVSGTVTAADGGAPLENIIVAIAVESLYQEGSYATSYSSDCTDASGAYSISNVPINRDFKVYAFDAECVLGDPQNVYAQEWYSEATTRQAATAQQINTEGGSLTNINFTLDLTASVSGTVYDYDGTTPLENLEVWVLDASYDYQISACTDANGNYTLDGITPNLDLKMYTGNRNFNNCGGSTSYDSTYYNQTTNEAAATVLNFTPGQSLSIDFTMLVAPKISGTVYLEDGTTPVSSMAVYAYSQNSSWNAGVCANQNGQYTMTNPPQDENLIVYVNGTLSCGPDYSFQNEYWQEAPNFDTATPIVLTSETPVVTGIDFTLSEAVYGSLTVSVLDDVTQEPVAGAYISVYSASPFYIWSNCTDENGEFTIESILVGTSVEIRAGNNFVGGNACNAPYIGEVDSLVIAEGSQTVAFALTLGGTISGDLTGPGGAAFTGGGTYWITALNAATGEQLASNSNAATGNTGYMVQGVPFDVPVVVYAQVAESGFPQTLYAREYWQEQTLSSLATPLTVTAANQAITNIDFTMTTVASGISGTIYDEDGFTPLQGVPVRIEGDNSFYTCSNEEGYYSIGYLVSGASYKVYAGGSHSICNDKSQPVVYYDAVANAGDATPVMTPAEEINFVMQTIVVPTKPYELVASELETVPVLPEFGWTGIAGVESYRLYMWNSANRATLIDQTFAIGDVCDGMVCSIVNGDYSSLRRWGLNNGSYEWWIGAKLEAGGWAWSDKASFSVDIPQPNFPANITVDSSNGRPVITWDYEANMTWVEIWVGPHPAGNYRAWHELNGPNRSFTCDEMANTCSMTLAWDVASKDAQGTPYEMTVWMRGWGPGGYGVGENPPLPNAPQWNSSSTFSLIQTAAETPTNLAVINGNLTNFTWTSGTGASWYHLRIKSQDGATILHSSWHEASTVDCVGAAQSCGLLLDLSAKLTDGQSYNAELRAWGPGGFSSFTALLPFTYDIP